MEDKLVQELIELQVRYFGSKFFSVKNWIMFNHIILPEGMVASDLDDWAPEKQLYLAQSKVDMDGIKSNYEAILVDRLDTAAALQEKIMDMLLFIEDSKEAKDIAQSMHKIAQLQDEAMIILKVDAYRSNLYEKNKTSTENLLKENVIDIS
jgi:hypothetical protein